MAFLGLMMAFSVVLVYLGNIIEVSTLFFLGMASFITGVVIVEYGTAVGASFYVGSVLLSFFLSPNKLYAFTYGGMALYLLLTEIVWRKVLQQKMNKRNNVIMLVLKVIVFNAMYIPILIYAPSLVLTKEINEYLLIGLILAGQVVLLIYDRAFHYFVGTYWIDIKRRLNI